VATFSSLSSNLPGAARAEFLLDGPRHAALCGRSNGGFMKSYLTKDIRNGWQLSATAGTGKTQLVVVVALHPGVTRAGKVRKAAPPPTGTKKKSRARFHPNRPLACRMAHDTRRVPPVPLTSQNQLHRSPRILHLHHGNEKLLDRRGCRLITVDAHVGAQVTRKVWDLLNGVRHSPCLRSHLDGPRALQLRTLDGMLAGFRRNVVDCSCPSVLKEDSAASSIWSP